VGMKGGGQKERKPPSGGPPISGIRPGRKKDKICGNRGECKKTGITWFTGGREKDHWGPTLKTMNRKKTKLADMALLKRPSSDDRRRCTIVGRSE